MKNALFLLFFALLPALACSQSTSPFPNNFNKARLGYATSGAGLIHTTDSLPDYTPVDRNAPVLHMDSTAGILYFWKGGVWNATAGADGNGMFSVGNNGDTVRINIAVVPNGPGFALRDVTSDVVFAINDNSVTATAGDASMQAVKSLGYLLLQGDSLVFQINGSTGLPGQVIIATGDGGAFWGDPTGATLANNGVSMSGDTVQLGDILTKNTEIDTDGKTFRIRDDGSYPDLLINSTYGIISSDVNTYLDIGSVAGRARIVAATTAQLTSAANTDVSATDTVTISGQRIRLNAADTRIQQVPNSNTLNRLMAIDSLTGRLYYIDKSSIAGGGGGSGTVTSITAGVGLTGGAITTSGTIAADTSGMLVSKSFLTNQGYTTNTGTVTGTGTTGTIPVWSSSSAVGDSPLTVSSGSVIAGGTGFFQPPVGTTAQRPGTPTAGMFRYNTTLGNYDFYGASAWKNFLESATGNGLGTAGRVFYADANGRAAAGDVLYWDATNKRFGANVSPTATFHARGTGATFATTAFIVENSTPTKLLEIRDHGVTKFNDAPTNQAVNFNSTGIFRMVWGSTLNTDANRSRWVIESGDGYLTRFGAANDAGSGSFDWGLVFNRGTGSTISQIRIQKPLRVNEQSEFAGSGALVVHGSGATSSTWIAQFHNSAGNNNTLMIRDDGLIGIGNAAPARQLHVTGEARITDLTTDTPTRIVGADADGDLGAITVSTGLSLSSGNLTADNLYTANGTLTGARTVTLGSNTFSMTGTSGGTNQVSFSMNPSTNTNGIQSIDGSLNNATITVTPARTQIVTINTTGGTAATLEVFADSVKISPTPISLNDTLSFLIGFNSTTGRLHRVTKSTLSGLSDPGSNGMLARTAANTTTARTITAGSGIAVTNGDGVSGNPSLSLEFSEGYLSVAGGGTTVTAATPERIDADSPGTATSSILGTEFSVSGSTIDWTGADDSMMKISGTVSFSISDNTDMKVSIYKEGVELAVTEVRVTMVAGDYHTVHLPEIHTAADDNDTFAVYVEPISGTTTTTVHKSHISIKKLY